MTFKEITDLIKMVNKFNLSEFKVKEGEFEMTIRSEIYTKVKSGDMTGVQPVISVPSSAVPLQVEPAAIETNSEPSSPTDKKEDEAYVEIKSPMVGTFYRSSSPDKPAYIKVGDDISPGAVVCIIEAMKLFNEIEAEISGKIVKILVDDASPVEYEQPLFLVDPTG